MCIPPPSDDVTRQRRWFAQLRELQSTLNRAGHALDVLSMGMSGDYEAAVREGATHVRIGTAIFGGVPRPTQRARQAMQVTPDRVHRRAATWRARCSAA